MSIADLIRQLPETVGDLEGIKPTSEERLGYYDQQFAGVRNSIEELLIHAGNLHRKNKDNESAKRCYEGAIGMNNLGIFSYRSYLGLGLIYIEEGNLDKAQEVLESAKGINDDRNSEVHFHLGNVYFKKDLLDEAEAQYREANKDHYHYAPACNMLGKVYIRRGNLKEAARWFRRSIRFDRGYVDAHSNLAVVYAKIGRDKAAKRQFGIVGLLAHKTQKE